jgi:hypothetical protein
MDVAIMGECPWVIPAVIVCGGGNVDFQPSYAWVKMEATKFEVPIPTLNAALDARYFSTMKDE